MIHDTYVQIDWTRPVIVALVLVTICGLLFWRFRAWRVRVVLLVVLTMSLVAIGVFVGLEQRRITTLGRDLEKSGDPYSILKSIRQSDDPRH